MTLNNSKKLSVILLPLLTLKNSKKVTSHFVDFEGLKKFSNFADFKQKNSNFANFKALRNSKPYGELILLNVRFEVFATYGVWSLFTADEYGKSLMFNLFGQWVLQSVILQEGKIFVLAKHYSRDRR